MRFATLGALCALLIAPAASAADFKTESVKGVGPELTLRTVAFEGGKTLNMTVGVGSALFRLKSDPAGVFWSTGDRGPNFTCAEAVNVIGIKGEDFCGANAKDGRIYPAPEYVPSIYELKVEGSSFKVVRTLPLKATNGKLVSGLLNPLTVASTETPIDANRKLLELDPSAVDLEGLVKLSDGTFWMGEENATSILHVSADGTILERIVPDGTSGDFAKAGYPVRDGLPAVLTKRALNRGIESMAVSADEKTLFFIVQNPLANPDTKAYGAARNTRLFALDRASGKLSGEWVYQLDAMDQWPGEEKKAQSTPRISELLWLAPNRLVVDERTEQTTKLHVIDLTGATNILGTAWDDVKAAPSLEQTDLATAGVTAVKKELLMTTAGRSEFPTKIEGVARVSDDTLALINDDDFGIMGGGTVMTLVSGLPLPR